MINISIFRGAYTREKTTDQNIKRILENVSEDAVKLSLSTEKTIDVCRKVSKRILEKEFKGLAFILNSMGFNKEEAGKIILDTSMVLSKDFLTLKLERELSSITPFKKRKISENISEVFVPRGTLVHIAASNHPSIAISTVLEGLLSGNINILKLPSSGNPYAEKILSMLAEEDKDISPFIYAVDIPSNDRELMRELLSGADCVCVWGSDKAVEGIKALIPPNTKLVSWGHRISFAYVSSSMIGDVESLEKIAHDICSSEQLFCSSPQCIFVEANNRDDINNFAWRFSEVMSRVSRKYPETDKDIYNQSEITTKICVAKTEEILGETMVIEPEDKSWYIIVRYDGILESSPLFRTVIIKPIKRDKISEYITPLKRYLQTSSLFCLESEREQICGALLKCGVSRICRNRSSQFGYAGEPHDGLFALREYVKAVDIYD